MNMIVYHSALAHNIGESDSCRGSRLVQLVVWPFQSAKSTVFRCGYMWSTV